MAYQPIFQNLDANGMPTEPVVDDLLGNAYKVVRYVAQNMRHVTEVSTNMVVMKEAYASRPAFLASVTAQAVLADDDRVAAEIAAAQALTRSAAAALSQYNSGLSEIAVEADRVAVAASKLTTDRFYPGTFAADPLVRPDGSAIQVGDEYFNSTTERRKIYSTTGWLDYVAAAVDSAVLAESAKVAAEAARDVALAIPANLAAIGGAATVGSTPSGGLSAITVQAALNELDTEKVAEASLAAAGGAGMVGNTPAGTISATTVQGAINEIVSDLAAPPGASTVGYLPAGVDAVATTVQVKLRQQYAVTEAGAIGNNVADDTAAQNKAVAYIQSTYDPVAYASASPANGPSTLFYPAGYYRTNGEVTVSKKVAFKGDGPGEFSSGSRVVQNAPANDLFKIAPIAQGMSVSFEDMTLIGNGTGAGHLINVTRTTAACNSQRYRSLVFGTPPTFALKIDAGDDIIIESCLFDVSANYAVAFGTSAQSNAVSNVRFDKAAFFAVNTICMQLYNIDGLAISGVQVYPSAPTNRTSRFIDGYNTLPYQIKNVSITGGTYKNVDCLVIASALENFKVSDTNCSGFGGGTGATLSGIQLHGANVGVTITGNTFKGGFDIKNFYNDSAGTVTQANITGNTFINTGGAGQALVCGNTTGVIANNTFIGFAAPSVSELVTTTAGAVSPGVIGSMAAWSYTATVTGAKQGDRVEMGIVDTAWPVPIGIEVQAFISAANTVSIQYRNVTASAIGVPSHDIRYCVTRGI